MHGQRRAPGKNCMAPPTSSSWKADWFASEVEVCRATPAAQSPSQFEVTRRTCWADDWYALSASGCRGRQGRNTTLTPNTVRSQRFALTTKPKHWRAIHAIGSDERGACTDRRATERHPAESAVMKGSQASHP